MTLSYEHRIIIQYIRNKFGHGVTRIVADHPEFDWNANTIKSFLQRINETGDVTRKEGSGRPRTARTEENIEQVGEMLCSQGDEWGMHQTPTETSSKSIVGLSNVLCVLFLVICRGVTSSEIKWAI